VAITTPLEAVIWHVSVLAKKMACIRINNQETKGGEMVTEYRLPDPVYKTE
jgi:hypothetical protein